MKFCFIAPVKYLHLTNYGSGHMILTPYVLSNSVYSEFYSKAEGYKILDNGLFELGKSASVDDVFRAMDIVNPTVVIAPDAINDSALTITQTSAFIRDLNEHCSENYVIAPKVMAVPHGRNLQEYLQCYCKLAATQGVDFIGLSKLGCPNALPPDSRRSVMYDRLAVILYLMSNGVWDVHKPHHLLGLGDSVAELSLYQTISGIHSCDSSLPIWQGLLGKMLYEYTDCLGSQYDETKMDINYEIPKDQMLGRASIVMNNIGQTLLAAKGGVL